MRRALSSKTDGILRAYHEHMKTRRKAGYHVVQSGFILALAREFGMSQNAVSSLITYHKDRPEIVSP